MRDGVCRVACIFLVFCFVPQFGQTFPHALIPRYTAVLLVQYSETDSFGVKQEQARILVHADTSFLCCWSWS